LKSLPTIHRRVALSWLSARIASVLRIAAVAVHGDDSGAAPIQQVELQGKGANSLAWYPYGLHAVALNESYSLLFTANGRPEERFHIPTSMGRRPQLSPGEVAVFHPETGTSIKLTNDGVLTIESAGNTVIKADNIELDGDVGITGDLTVDGNADVGINLDVTAVMTADSVVATTSITMPAVAMAGGVDVGSGHVHDEGSYTDSVPLALTCGTSGTPQ